jgi:hypothetical protein
MEAFWMWAFAGMTSLYLTCRVGKEIYAGLVLQILSALEGSGIAQFGFYFFVERALSVLMEPEALWCFPSTAVI